MARKGISMTIETLGKLVLLVIIAVAIIVFIVTALTTQGNIFNETSSEVVGGLFDKAENASSGMVIT